VKLVAQNTTSDTSRTAVGMAPQIPKTHKAAMFKEKGGPLVLEEIETKMPEEGEVLVKVLACGVCHSEVVAQQALFGTPLYAFTTQLVQEVC